MCTVLRRSAAHPAAHLRVLNRRRQAVTCCSPPWRQPGGGLRLTRAQLCLMSFCQINTSKKCRRAVNPRSASQHEGQNMARAWVMVLGDVGRSPRMQYHTLSLCKTEGYQVHLIGQRGSALIKDLQEPLADGRLAVHYVPELPRWLLRLPGPLRLPLKALLQLLALLWMLLISLPRPDVILLQLPPAIPTMLVCRLAALRHRACLVFDWHNFAYTLMAIGMGRRHPLVRIAESYERYWGRTADASLCVTHAMQQELAQNWRVAATVFHDRPPAFFRPASLAEKHDLLQRLQPALAAGLHPHDFCAAMCAALGPRHTICTEQVPSSSDGSSRRSSAKGGSADGSASPGVQLRAQRPALVVSSTSWTPDEDFGLLLRAAELYDAKARRSRQPYPRILFLITGRGPQRQAYEQRLREMDLRHVAFRTLWLEPEDYPVLLGSVDLGVSLHASSSGLDLPMKVVDMFGCGLPVCALSYSCIGELVSHEHNGLLFATPEQLAQQFLDLFRGFPVQQDEESSRAEGQQQEGSGSRAAAGTNCKGGTGVSSGGGSSGSTLLRQLRSGLESDRFPRWDESWRRIVLPVLSAAAK